MLKEPETSEFVLIKESDNQESRKYWSGVAHWEKTSNVKSTMVSRTFKRKRFPDGRINKHKTRLGAHYIIQTHGVNYWDTYLPTVNWKSVYFLLMVAQILDFHTQAIHVFWLSHKLI